MTRDDASSVSAVAAADSDPSLSLDKLSLSSSSSESSLPLTSSSLYPPLLPSLFNGLSLCPSIAEPVFDTETSALLAQLSAAVLERFERHGLTFSPEFSSSGIDTQHWREIYVANRHLTRFIPSEDPRFLSLFNEAEYSPSTQPSAWSPSLLHHFLVARKNDVTQAARMFADYLAWRHCFGIDDLARQEPMPFADLIDLYVAHRMHQRDAKGRPFYIQRTGLIDPLRFTERVPDGVLALTHCHWMERNLHELHLASVASGKRVDRLINLIDTKGFTLAHAKIIKFFRTTTLIDQAFYPETLDAFIMANAPPFLPTLVSLAKPFLDAKTLSKFFVLGSTETLKLGDMLGVELTPTEYGGKCECDGGCVPTLLDIRLKQEKKSKAFQQETSSEVIKEEKVTIAPAKIVDKDIYVSASFTPRHDPAFTRFVCQPVRVETGVRQSEAHDMFELLENEVGTIKLVADNSPSRFTSKTLTLRYAIHRIPSSTTTS